MKKLSTHQNGGYICLHTPHRDGKILHATVHVKQRSSQRGWIIIVNRDKPVLRRWDMKHALCVVSCEQSNRFSLQRKMSHTIMPMSPLHFSLVHEERELG